MHGRPGGADELPGLDRARHDAEPARAAAALPPLPAAPPARALEPLACGAEHHLGEVLAAGVEYCDGLGHFLGDGTDRRGSWVRDCPTRIVEQSRARVRAENERLAKVLETIDRCGTGHDFEHFDVTTIPTLAAALRAVRSFAKARPPKRNLVLQGPTGTGKTRLFLAAHLALLDAGVDSEFITSAELRALYREDARREPDARRPAALQRLYRAQVVFIDELGDVENDARGPGLFREGIKALLEGMAGALATSTNLSSQALEKHPDVGSKVLSRLLAGAYLVIIDPKAEDWRYRSVEMVGAKARRPEGNVTK